MTMPANVSTSKKRGYQMKWLTLAAMLGAAIHLATAQSAASNEITAANVVDHLVAERTIAENSVRLVKSTYKPNALEYARAKQKYSAAQTAYNNYISVMLTTCGQKINGNFHESASLAADKSKDFDDYVVSLNIPSRGPASKMDGVGVLIDIANVVYQWFKPLFEDRCVRLANSIGKEVIWDDWDSAGG